MRKKCPAKKQWTNMDYVKPMVRGAWQGMYTCWTNPAMWSDQMVYRTLRQVGGKPYTAKDVRSIIRSYCKVMREQVKKSMIWM